MINPASALGMIALVDPNLNAIAQTSALRLVDCLLQGVLIAIFAGLVLRVFRRQSSGTRFAVWFSALMAIAALPLLTSLWQARAVTLSGSAARAAEITLPGSWAHYLFGAWAAIAAWLLVKVGLGLRGLYVLRKSCVPIDPAGLDIRLQATLEGTRSKRPVALCTSELVNVPTAVGLLKPAVVLPRWVMQELSAEEVNQILLHELAHLRRWDDWTNLAQKIVKALFFFHPAVWWIEKQVSLEREMACDDAVLAETASPRAYAECLAHLAEKTLIQRSMALAQAALGRIRQTSLRVEQILDVNRPTETGRTWKPAVSVVAGFALVCALGISRTPRLIAFSDSEPRVLASYMNSLPDAHVPASNAVFRVQPVRVVPASLSIHATHRSSQNFERTGAVKSARQRTGSMVRQTSFRITNGNAVPLAFTETIFVIVEGRENGSSSQPVYQIQLWRLTVLHPAVDSDNNRIPAKQT